MRDIDIEKCKKIIIHFKKGEIEIFHCERIKIDKFRIEFFYIHEKEKKHLWIDMQSINDISIQ